MEFMVTFGNSFGSGSSDAAMYPTLAEAINAWKNNELPPSANSTGISVDSVVDGGQRGHVTFKQVAPASMSDSISFVQSTNPKPINSNGFFFTVTNPQNFNTTAQVQTVATIPIWNFNGYVPKKMTFNRIYLGRRHDSAGSATSAIFYNLGSPGLQVDPEDGIRILNCIGVASSSSNGYANSDSAYAYGGGGLFHLTTAGHRLFLYNNIFRFGNAHLDNYVEYFNATGAVNGGALDNNLFILNGRFNPGLNYKRVRNNIFLSQYNTTASGVDVNANWNERNADVGHNLFMTKYAINGSYFSGREILNNALNAEDVYGTGLTITGTYANLPMWDSFHGIVAKFIPSNLKMAELTTAPNDAFPPDRNSGGGFGPNPNPLSVFLNGGQYTVYGEQYGPSVYAQIQLVQAPSDLTAVSIPDSAPPTIRLTWTTPVLDGNLDPANFRIEIRKMFGAAHTSVADFISRSIVIATLPFNTALFDDDGTIAANSSVPERPMTYGIRVVKAV